MTLEIYAKRDGGVKATVRGVRSEVCDPGQSAALMIETAGDYIGAHLEITRVTVSERKGPA